MKFGVTLGNPSLIMLLFLVCGVFAYFVDYKSLKKYPEYAREQKFSKFISYLFVIGSMLGFITLLVVYWIS